MRDIIKQHNESRKLLKTFDQKTTTSQITAGNEIFELPSLEQNVPNVIFSG